jgi:hypothetical protein
VKLLPEGTATGGHSVFDPLTELLIERFRGIKETFDDHDSGHIQLPQAYRDAQGNSCSIEVAERYRDVILDGVVELSR